MADQTKEQITTALLAAKLAKSSLEMLGERDAFLLRPQLKQVAEDFKALGEHVNAIAKVEATNG